MCAPVEAWQSREAWSHVYTGGCKYKLTGRPPALKGKAGSVLKRPKSAKVFRQSLRFAFSSRSSASGVSCSGFGRGAFEASIRKFGNSALLPPAGEEVERVEWIPGEGSPSTKPIVWIRAPLKPEGEEPAGGDGEEPNGDATTPDVAAQAEPAAESAAA